jgi:hypothetical protein
MSFDLTDDELRALIDHHEIQREKSSMMAKDHDMRCVKYQTELQGRNEESKGRKQLAEDGFGNEESGETTGKTNDKRHLLAHE